MTNGCQSCLRKVNAAQGSGEPNGKLEQNVNPAIDGTLRRPVRYLTEEVPLPNGTKPLLPVGKITSCVRTKDIGLKSFYGLTVRALDMT